MKKLVLAGSIALALAAAPLVANAEPIVFDYTGSLVTFTVPGTGIYQILAYGAQGGNDPLPLGGPGGRGAEIGGQFSLTEGEVLQVAVGGAGMDGGGGGGGSFVVGLGNTPLVIAGGGGGGGSLDQAFPFPPPPGGGGLTGADGGGRGGTGGNGGNGGIPFGGGGGGGGFWSGGSIGFSPGGTGGGGFPSLAGGFGNHLGGFLFGGDGGFGGGGGGGVGTGGGGGGYSGGGGGDNIHGIRDGGGGGGSLDAGTDQILVADFQTGNSQVIITELPGSVPEPASLAILGTGLVGLAAQMRRRQPYLIQTEEEDVKRLLRSASAALASCSVTGVGAGWR